jgi:anti-anti-sigma factor
MEITQHIVNDVTVLTLKGRVVTEDRDVLGTAIDALVEQGRVKLILDLQDVTYVDSSGLGLLEVCDRAPARGGRQAAPSHPTQLALARGHASDPGVRVVRF